MNKTAALITDEELQADLKALEVEAMGWLPLTTEEGDSAYLHVGDPEALVIEVTGVPEAGMAGVNVLLVGW